MKMDHLTPYRAPPIIGRKDLKSYRFTSRQGCLEKSSEWYKVRPLQQGVCAKAGSEGSSYNNRHS
jgi:hypothetical protein